MPIDNSNDLDGWDYTEKKDAPPTPENKNRSTNYDIFMKLKPRKEPYIVRFVSKPKNFRSHWRAFRPLFTKAMPVRSPAYEKSDKGLDIAWCEGDWMPSIRHAAKVFDRGDNNYIKILEAGNEIYEAVGNWSVANKINPAGPNATDWAITVKTEGKSTKYSASPMMPTPFTDEEKLTIEHCPLNLDRIIKIKTPEEIKEMWLKLSDDQKYNPDSKYKAGHKFDAKVLEKYNYSKDDKKDDSTQNVPAAQPSPPEKNESVDEPSNEPDGEDSPF